MMKIENIRHEVGPADVAVAAEIKRAHNKTLKEALHARHEMKLLEADTEIAVAEHDTKKSTTVQDHKDKRHQRARSRAEKVIESAEEIRDAAQAEVQNAKQKAQQFQQQADIANGLALDEQRKAQTALQDLHTMEKRMGKLEQQRNDAYSKMQNQRTKQKQREDILRFYGMAFYWNLG